MSLSLISSSIDVYITISNFALFGLNKPPNRWKHINSHISKLWFCSYCFFEELSSLIVKCQQSRTKLVTRPAHRQKRSEAWRTPDWGPSRPSPPWLPPASPPPQPPRPGKGRTSRRPPPPSAVAAETIPKQSFASSAEPTWASGPWGRELPCTWAWWTVTPSAQV